MLYNHKFIWISLQVTLCVCSKYLATKFSESYLILTFNISKINFPLFISRLFLLCKKALRKSFLSIVCNKENCKRIKEKSKITREILSLQQDRCGLKKYRKYYVCALYAKLKTSCERKTFSFNNLDLVPRLEKTCESITHVVSTKPRCTRMISSLSMFNFARCFVTNIPHELFKILWGIYVWP